MYTYIYKIYMSIYTYVHIYPVDWQPRPSPAIAGSVLQCVAVFCSVLQCVAVAECCSVLQCVAVCRSESQCVAVCCSVVQRAKVRCSMVQCVAVCCSVLQCVAACCNNTKSSCSLLQEIWLLRWLTTKNNPLALCWIGIVVRLPRSQELGIVVWLLEVRRRVLLLACLEVRFLCKM